MSIIIFLITIVFLCSAFISKSPQQIIQNSLFSYFIYEISFITKNFGIFILGFVVLTLIFFRFNFSKKFSILKIYFFSSLQTIFVGTVGFFIAYILLFVIAFVQLNIFSLLINISYKIIGLESDRNIIINKIKDNNFTPEIIISDYDQGSILSAITSVTTGTNNYYGKNILPSIPHFLVIPIKKPEASFVLIDNSLIVIQTKEKDLQMISPFVGYHFLKDYFPTKKIKQDAKILVLNKDKYSKYREEDVKKKLEMVDNELEKIEEKVSSLSATIEINKENISKSQELIKQEKTQSYDDYRKCILEKNPTELCKDLQNRWNDKIKLENEKIKVLNKKIESDQKLIEAYKSYDEFFRSQRENIKLLTKKVSREDGIFMPKNSIRIVVTGSNSKNLIVFFETLIHEYLHFTSYNSDTKRFESSFFEEGLTEYFARKIIENSLHTKTNLGYPVQVKIISAMTNMITEGEFADIYFNKDQQALERALDRVYGEGFYKNNYISFETLQYISDPKEVLKIANGIMQKIGGEKLVEKDLVGRYSSM